jgi:hypothetical protein
LPPGCFLIFNQCIFEVIKTHHDIKEQYIFPAIENYTGVVGIMDQNFQEHRAFRDGLDRFCQYVYKTDANRYDGKTLQAIIDEFGKPLEKYNSWNQVKEINIFDNIHCEQSSSYSIIIREG